jgi:ribosomal protein L37E
LTRRDGNRAWFERQMRFVARQDPPTSAEPGMLRCRSCGHEALQRARQCPECGSSKLGSARELNDRAGNVRGLAFICVTMQFATLCVVVLVEPAGRTRLPKQMDVEAWMSIALLYALCSLASVPLACRCAVPVWTRVALLMLSLPMLWEANRFILDLCFNVRLPGLSK